MPTEGVEAAMQRLDAAEAEEEANDGKYDSSSDEEDDMVEGHKDVAHMARHFVLSRWFDLFVLSSVVAALALGIMDMRSRVFDLAIVIFWTAEVVLRIYALGWSEAQPLASCRRAMLLHHAHTIASCSCDGHHAHAITSCNRIMPSHHAVASCRRVMPIGIMQSHPTM